MRAIVYDRYGPPEVLRLDNVQQPVPAENEVLVKVHATTVNRTDCAVRGGDGAITRLGYSYLTTGSPTKALLRPRTRILGTELAGEVAAVGMAVSEFRIGDRVFGLNPGRFGAHAEYVCLREGAPLAHMPANMTFEEAAAVCDGALLALGCLRRVGLRQGHRILVYGASGSIGTAAVQLARSRDAHVTAVCSTKNVDLMPTLGADAVIDYTREDFTQNGEAYDVIFDAAGKHAFGRCRGSLKPAGVYIATDGLENLLWAVRTAMVGDKRVVFDIPPRYRKRDVVYLKELIEAGRYRAVIDRCYPLEDVIAATRYVETEQKTGNVVLTVAGG